MAVTCVLLAVICVMNAGLRQKIAANNEVIAGLEAEIEEEQGRTEKIEEEKKYMDSDEYVEKIAHEKIGLVYDNETIFKENRYDYGIRHLILTVFSDSPVYNSPD